MTVAINKLVKKGYVKKEKSNTDGRVVYVRLTDKGLRIDKIHQYFHVKMVKDISKEMTDEEKEVLIHGMEKLNGFFRKKLSRLSDENETSEPWCLEEQMSFTIIGTGSALPKTIQTNEDLAQFLDTSHDWIVSRTGIEARHICVDESILDIALEAKPMPLTDDASADTPVVPAAAVAATAAKAEPARRSRAVKHWRESETASCE